MKSISKITLTILITLGLLNGAEKGKIRIEGSTTLLPIAQITAEEFMNIYPQISVSVKGGGSGVGIAALIEGSCDIATSSRAMKDTEIKDAIAKGVNPVAHIVGMDGIAIIVHPSNPIKNLSKADLKRIYTGKISNWKDLGGSDMKIVVISRDVASGTYEAFGKLALDDEKVRKDALLNASNKAVVTAVEKTPGAIGYVGLGYITPNVKAITIDGVECTRENVLTKKYPLSRPLFMYTNGKPSGVIKTYLDFVLSKEGQKLINEAGFVGLK